MEQPIENEGSRAPIAKRAVLYRMAMPNHTCPYGLLALNLLRSRGFDVDDRPLATRDEVDAFKVDRNVSTTPQIYVGGTRIGGHDDLRRFLGLKVNDPDATSYIPVLTVFAATGAMALAASEAAFGTPLTLRAAEWFIAFSMVVLAMLKLQDVRRFVAMFLNYDLLARRWVPYATIYPFAEFVAGVLMTAQVLNWISLPLALFVGTVGAVSVFYAVYVKRRELNCACVGGSSRVPLGFLSLTENLMMVAMAVWMIFSHN